MMTGIPFQNNSESISSHPFGTLYGVFYLLGAMFDKALLLERKAFVYINIIQPVVIFPNSLLAYDK